MNSDKWLEAATVVEAEIERLKEAAAKYRENAAQGILWPSSGTDVGLPMHS